MVTTQKMVTRVCVSYPKHGFLSYVDMMALCLLVQTEPIFFILTKSWYCKILPYTGYLILKWTLGVSSVPFPF